MKKTLLMMLALTASLFLFGFGDDGCDDSRPTTDQKQSNEQAKALEQAHNQIGMPAVTSFSERHMVKDLYEMRDKPAPTHTYVFSEQRGCLLYLGASMGYGLPYATQFTSPTRTVDMCPNSSGHYCFEQLPQAEPNGLFMPASAEGTWVLLKEPGGDQTRPVYVEPRVVVSPFRLTDQECSKEPAPKPGKQ